MSADEQYPMEEAEETPPAVVDEEQPPSVPSGGEEPIADTPNLAQPPVSTLPMSATHVERDPTQDEDPTYTVEPWGGLTRFVCLLDGHEDWSFDTFRQHMQVYHRDILREAPAGPGPEEPAPQTVDAAQESAGQAEATTQTDPEASPEASAQGG